MIRDIDPEVAALNIFSIVFQMEIVWKIYDQKPPVTNDSMMENFFEIFLNGILVPNHTPMNTNTIKIKSKHLYVAY